MEPIDRFSFKVNDGQMDSDVAVITVKVVSTEASTSRVSGRVISTSAEQLSDVAINVFKDGKSLEQPGSTDSQGRFNIELAADTDFALQFVATGYATQVIPVKAAEENKTVSLNVVLIQRAAVQNFSGSVASSISSLDGAAVTVDAGAFVDAQGDTVSENIEVSITPVDVSSPAGVHAFPGNFEGIAENATVTTPIISYGAVEYIFRRNGEVLQLAPGKSAQIKIPLYLSRYQDGSDIQAGDSIPLWWLNEDTGIWKQEGEGTVVTSSASPVGMALEASVSHFTWWNIDIPMDQANAIVTVGAPSAGDAVINGKVDGNIAWLSRGAMESARLGVPTKPLQIPANVNVCFWADVVLDNNTQAVTPEKCIKATNGETVNVTLEISGSELGITATPQSITTDQYRAAAEIRLHPVTAESQVKYQIVSGVLPSGVALSQLNETRAVISGIPESPGVFEVLVEGEDDEGNTATELISYTVIEDETAPVITLERGTFMEILFGSLFEEPGSSAIDNIDGFVPVSVTGSVDSEVVGTYSLIYTAFDKAGNQATATRRVSVVDKTPPVLAIKGEESYSILLGQSFADPGYSVEDNADETPVVVVTGEVITSVPGSYTLSYTASDASGNEASVTRTVHVVDTTKPVLLLNGANPLILVQGSVYEDPGAVATDDSGSVVDVVVSGSVDTSTPGDYIVSYTATDSSNNAIVVTRTVTVNAAQPSDARAGLTSELVNSEVKIFRVENSGEKTLLFTELTDEHGRFNSHKSELENESFYIYQLTGGETVGESSNKNHGSLRSIVKGEWIKNPGHELSLSVISEMAYVLVAPELRGPVKTSELEESLDEAARKLLIADISGNGEVDAEDTVVFDYLVNQSVISSRYPDSKISEMIASILEGSLKYINTLQNPVISVYDTPGRAYEILISADGKRAFLADQATGVIILDISDPRKPTEISVLKTGRSAIALALSADENTLFIADYTNSLVIADVSDPAQPVQIGHLENGGEAWKIALSPDGETIYLAGYDDGLIIVDVSDPANPVQTAVLTMAPNVLDVKASSDGRYTYLATDSGSSDSGGLEIVDVTDPENPVLSARVALNGAREIALSKNGNNVFVVTSNGLINIDISDPLNPIEVGVLHGQSGSSVALSPSGQMVYLGGHELVAINVSEIENPVIAGSLSTSLAASHTETGELFAQGFAFLEDENIIYVPAEKTGLVILSTDFPNNAGYVGDSENLSFSEISASDLSDSGDRILVADKKEISVIDIRDSENPVATAVLELADEVSWLNDVAISADGNKALIASSIYPSAEVLDILDLSDLKNPQKIGSYSAENEEFRTISISNDGQKAYLAGSRFSVIDISDGSNPRQIGSLDMSAFGASEIVLSEDERTVFLLDSRKLIIVDISDPASPELIGEKWISPGQFGNLYARDLFLSQDQLTAFVALNSGVEIINVSNPENPVFSGYIDGLFNAFVFNMSAERKMAIATAEHSRVDLFRIFDDVYSRKYFSLNIPGYWGRNVVLLSEDGGKAYILNYSGLVIVDLKLYDAF